MNSIHNISLTAKNALIWITDLLKNLAIPYQITGGLAAKIYGSSRELADIDIDIPEPSFEIIFPHVKDFIIFGPEQYKDLHWDLLLMTLNYHGQHIDLSGAYETKLFDIKSGYWIRLAEDLTKVQYIKYCGVTLPVISKHYLIEYKSKLARDEDLDDVTQIK